MRPPVPMMPIEDLDADSDDVPRHANDDVKRTMAQAAWTRLRQVELDADTLGGRELSFLVSCAREVLERRWGRFDC